MNKYNFKFKMINIQQCHRKGIHISEVKTVIYPVNHCPEIPLTVNQLYINTCENSCKKKRSEK